MTEVARGTCTECGGPYALRRDGTVRRHHRGLYGPYCAGGLLPPVEDPLRGEVGELRREVDRLRSELRRAELALTVEQAKRHAAEAHARAGDRWREVARIAVDGMSAEFDAENAKYEARVAEILADHRRPG